MKFSGVGKITRQGQITLPAETRKDMDLGIGDTIEFYSSDNLIIVKKKPNPVEIFDTLAAEIRGRIKKIGAKKEDVLKEIERYRKEKYAKA